eukprot:Tbor_TRINITY_DN4137_c0_g1::TRINITY_DN4137_c0_g1_i1::g.26486::m.26486
MTVTSISGLYTLALAISSISRILPKPAKLPLDRQRKEQRTLISFRYISSGEKNIASSSGCAKTNRTGPLIEGESPLAARDQPSKKMRDNKRRNSTSISKEDILW